MAEPPALSFIETQLPVSKLSKECYKERKANYSQTLTGLGKWWGRKPLILVRAAIVGLLMPASRDPRRDREIFLKILTMDDEGLLRRKSKAIALDTLCARLTPREREKWFGLGADPAHPRFSRAVSREEKDQIQQMVFLRMSYDERLTYCDRPEQIEGPSAESWGEINAHLGTHATCLPELVQELGIRRFGHVPRVGDAFCGGGSIPFEAARIGCEAYGSDLNPVAALLTWASLNIVGGGEEVARRVRAAQEEVYQAVDQQVTEWGIEHNEAGHRADAYLYCCETRCPECGWSIPLAPSWVIGEKSKCVAVLVPDTPRQRFHLEIRSGVSASEMRQARDAGTVGGNALHCPNPACRQSTPMAMVRGDRRSKGASAYGLRLWENDDLVPRPADVFQERLYCIRYVRSWTSAQGKVHTERYFTAPNPHDLQREARVLQLLRERFPSWQAAGFIPSAKIEPGDKTIEPIRNRGWTHWHHLFNPRQLLVNGLFLSKIGILKETDEKVSVILGAGRLADWNCKLCRWTSHGANEKSVQVFYDQALNPLMNYGCRTTQSLFQNWITELKTANIPSNFLITLKDARQVDLQCEFWITDPPYADAVNYHELTEFFLSWYSMSISRIFTTWYSDSKRFLAIKSGGGSFTTSMIDCYSNLAGLTPQNGFNIVTFTHKEPKVWAELTLILWASGLEVIGAWCVATETDSAIKEGNHVEGTVLLILKRNSSQLTAFLDEVIPKVEHEVRHQLDSMLGIDDRDDPNFSDTDYQLAAYAAALRVLTSFKSIEDIDVAHELSRARKPGEKSKIEAIIDDAVRTACDHLVPVGFDAFTWKTLLPDERFYLKGLEIESHGEYRSGAYQELARGFGLRDYKLMLANAKANQIRLKTATEFGRKNLGGEGFDGSLVRHALFAVRETAAQDLAAREGRNWLYTELQDRYWNHRKTLITLLHYFASRSFDLPHWKSDGEAARLLAGYLENDHAGA